MSSLSNKGFAVGAAMLVAAVLSTGQARADVIQYTGDTTGGPTFNRPVAGDPPASLSGFATNVAYDVQPFFVTESANYSMVSVATGWDNYLFLYQDSFDPNSPLTNALIGNDDFPIIGLSGFTYDLVAGVQYFLVTTGFDNSDFGLFGNTIAGGTTDGNIVLGIVPEPGTITLTGLGLVLAGWYGRRRRAA